MVSLSTCLRLSCRSCLFSGSAQAQSTGGQFLLLEVLVHQRLVLLPSHVVQDFPFWELLSLVVLLLQSLKPREPSLLSLEVREEQLLLVSLVAHVTVARYVAVCLVEDSVGFVLAQLLAELVRLAHLDEVVVGLLVLYLPLSDCYFFDNDFKQLFVFFVSVPLGNLRPDLSLGLEQAFFLVC